MVSHQSLTDFVVTSLLRVSEEALQRQRMIHLSNRDRDLFLTALEADFLQIERCAKRLSGLSALTAKALRAVITFMTPSNTAP